MPFEGIPLLVSGCAGSFPNMWPGGVTVTQENYWNSSGHFSAHDPKRGEKKPPKKQRGGEKRDVSAVWGPCGFGDAAAAEERWAGEKQAVLIRGEMQIMWSDPPTIPRIFMTRTLLTGLKECMLACVVRISTTRQSSVKSFESGWRQISAAVRPAATGCKGFFRSDLIFFNFFADSFWPLPDIETGLPLSCCTLGCLKGGDRRKVLRPPHMASFLSLRLPNGPKRKWSDACQWNKQVLQLHAGCCLQLSDD